MFSRILRCNFCSSKNFLQKNPLISAVYKKLTQMHQDYENVSELLCKPNAGHELQKQITSLQIPNHQYNQMHQIIQEIQDLEQLYAEEKEQWILNEIQIQGEKAEKVKENALEQMSQKGKYDDCENVLMELRPGVGGQEASLFAYELYEMYQNFMNEQGWRCLIFKKIRGIEAVKGVAWKLKERKFTESYNARLVFIEYKEFQKRMLKEGCKQVQFKYLQCLRFLWNSN